MTAKVPMSGHGQGQAGDDGGREIAQEQEDDQDHQASGQEQGELHVVDGIPDGLGAVVETCPDSTEAGIWARKVGQQGRSTESTTSMVLVPGWRWMARTMASGAVVPTGDFVVFHTVDDPAEFLEPDGRAVAIGDDERPVGLRASFSCPLAWTVKAWCRPRRACRWAD